ncbi:MAG TPA: hypothetical protein P5256_11015 [Beijerinckiaceae bacterium]|nr:hypothetical protein [Rhodoblastus sp.]HRY03652.1 hypothetical protein [Beijerinckiaceae bacterium]
MADTKIYVTTDKAGPRVAGRHVPYDNGGNTKVGFELTLTDREAEYELSHGTIALKPDGRTKASSKPAGDGQTGNGSTGA